MVIDVSDIVPWSELIENRARRLGREEGMKKGFEEGLEKGLEEAGRAPLRRTFLAIAAARGFGVSAGERETLDRCTDLDTLVRWTVGLARASNVSEAMIG
jgi:hypothetical protein